MEYSEKLNGYWEEGYHFFFEIRNEKLTVREYRRKIVLETVISYDAAGVEAGRKTQIRPADNVLSRGGDCQPMSWFEELCYEDGEIHLVEGYSFMDRRDSYVMKKVDHGPFDHIIIRDAEFRDRLQGVWLRWSPSGDYSEDRRSELVIEGDTFRGRFMSGRFHVVSYDRTYDRDSVYLVPWDLTEDDFPGCTHFEVFPDMLTTHEIVFDMSTPLSVYAREADIGRIQVPESAKGGYTSAMGPGAMPGPMTAQNPIFANFAKMAMMNTNPFSPAADSARPEASPVDNGIQPEFLPCESESDDPRRLKKPYACKTCGQIFSDRLPKFCHNCGSRL